MPESFTLSDFLAHRVRDLRQPAPILQFYEVAIPDGSFQRYVDFADKDAGGSLPNKIPFNGVEFTATAIERGELQEGLEGSSATISVSVYDPLHAAAYFLRQYGGLTGCQVILWIAAYDRLDTPADAFTETFEIISATVGEGPSSVTLTLGHANLYETRIPKLFYDRRKCINPYHDRFIPGKWCRYPSNEFGTQTREDLLAGAIYYDAPRKYGWSTAQARRASVFDVDLATSGSLTITTADARIAWKNRERYGPSFFRSIPGAWDLEVPVVAPATSRSNWMAGIFAMSPAGACPDLPAGEEPPPGLVASWLFWGLQDNGAGAARLLMRKTEENASLADVVTVSAHTYLRMARSGSTFTLYSKAAAGDVWTSRGTATLSLPDPAIVGLLVASDARTTDSISASFDYIRFSSGGLSACRRTWEDCQLHGNTHHFNGFVELPNDRARY